MLSRQMSPLHIVAGQGNAEAAAYLLERGHPVDPRISTGHTPLHIAAQEGSIEVACLLVDGADAQIDAKTAAGITPLYLAIQKGKLSTACALIERGASVDAATETGHSALHVAAHFGLFEAAELLIQKGCEVDARTNIGHTPLHLAALHDQPLVAKLLLKSGRAAVDVEDNTGRRPLHLAAQRCAAEVVEALLSAGASLDAVSSRGLMALECALYGASPSSRQLHATVEVLLAGGASAWSAHKWNGQSALHVAAFLGQQECVEMLVSRGAIKDETFYLQTGDGLATRACSLELSGEPQAAAYKAAARVAPGCLDAYLRLGGVQVQMGASEDAVETFKEAWKRDDSRRKTLDVQKYVEEKCELAKMGQGRSAAAATLDDLSVYLNQTDYMRRALALWRQQGVVVWPALLDEGVVEAARRQALVVLESEQRAAVDRSCNIRQPGRRTLRAMGVEEGPDALAAIAQALASFLEEALKGDRQLVLEHAAYRSAHGAAEQEWHRDDGVIDSRIVSVQVALVDTAFNQGALEVAPATHRADAAERLPMHGQFSGLSMAVPAGSVVMYSPNLLHRGRANQHGIDRLILTFTLAGKHGLVPNGIPLAVQPQDEGRWWLRAGRLESGLN